MLQFQYPLFFYALIILPLSLVWMFWIQKQRRKSIRTFGDVELMDRLMPQYSVRRFWVRYSIWSFAMLMLIIGLTNPRIGSKLEKVNAKGIDIMIALDVSNSMLSEDVSPNRLESAKLAISRLVDNLRSDRIGMVVFAGKGYVQLPITTDYAAAKLFLMNIKTTLVPTQGTAIGNAIELASQSFNDEKNSRAIIVISDGENHEDDGLSAAKDAASKGIRVFTIGIGSVKGTPVPDVDASGRAIGYKRDGDGNTVVSRLNEKMLQDIAQAGGGMYVYASNTGAALKKVKDELSKLAENEYDAQLYSDYIDRFSYFLMAALVILLLEMVISNKKSRWEGKMNLFGSRELPKRDARIASVVLLIIFSPIMLMAQKVEPAERQNVRAGNKLYEQGKYQEAVVKYMKALEANPGSVPAAFNLGSALYRNKNGKEASQLFSNNAQRKDIDEKQASKLWYNAGNSFLQQKDYQNAVEAFKNSLKIDPDNGDTRYNLAYAQKMLKNQQDKNKDKNKDQNKDQKQPNKYDKKDAERMLEAMKNAEQKTLENLKQKKEKGTGAAIEKDW